MKKQVEIIEILWEGPFNVEAVKEMDKAWDYGIYQIYGSHPIFGPDSLLYIGKAQSNSFAERIPTGHEFWFSWERAPVQIYVGRLAGNKTPYGKKWDRMIDTAEKLLIFYTSPPYNSKNIQDYSGKIKSTVVINYKSRNRLPDVVTTLVEECDVGSDECKEFGKRKV